METPCRTFPSPPRVRGPSAIPTWAPTRSRSRTRSPRSHYELECKAIFERSWLNVGRVEQLPKKGSYFTKEIAAARTSVILVRGGDDQVRAFHNICRHRGNKLVWDDHPDEETKGSCRSSSASTTPGGTRWRAI